ncbi:hypothetical protein DiNV_CH01M_ORF99 [Drosophila innubila nudivirus]|uniref:Uncharacterized protein n=1 Tax=Drosophila innubila nudivirus TaxID=2057187 RepID=A0A2H4UXE0_9VIRU|nr:hypothetical protein DiNV_CH01M_ORF99 [Drosophila innubila nudivirus]ATZ81587.1 hypothetical protein DiNV_CH01M_ORF99 [Drosophila innubila nudivirus]
MLTEVLKTNPINKQQKDIRANSKNNYDSDNEHDDDDDDDSDENDKYNNNDTNTSHNDSAYASSSSSSYKYNKLSQQMAKPLITSSNSKIPLHHITNSSPNPKTKYNTRNAVSKSHFINKLFDILNSFLTDAHKESQDCTKIFKTPTIQSNIKIKPTFKQ